jgi:hypothetical protein
MPALILRLKAGGAFNRDGQLVSAPFGSAAIARSTGGTPPTPERAVIGALDDQGPMSIKDMAVAVGEGYDATREAIEPDGRRRPDPALARGLLPRIAVRSVRFGRLGHRTCRTHRTLRTQTS